MGDGDGVIVVPGACKRTEDEKLATKQIAAGGTLWELHGLAERCASLGIAEIGS